MAGMLRFIVVLLLLPFQLLADQSEDDRLVALMRFDALATVTRAEGLFANKTLLADFGLPADVAAWDEKLSVIFDHQQIEDLFATGFINSFNPRSTGPVIAFLQDPDWIRIATLQNDASIAMLNAEVKDASLTVYWDQVDQQSDRLHLLEDLLASTNLIDQNVAAALNGMITLNQGMASLLPDLSFPEDELFAMALAQEDSMRAEIAESLLSF